MKITANTKNVELRLDGDVIGHANAVKTALWIAHLTRGEGRPDGYSGWFSDGHLVKREEHGFTRVKVAAYSHELAQIIVQAIQDGNVL